MRAAGLRERKKQKTRDAIQRVAMRLFEKQGYDETTIEEIAAAVEISPSTFFNYFPTKEDVVLYDAYDPMALAMFRELPKDEPLDTGIRKVLQALGAAMERDADTVSARARLVMQVPELRARMWEDVERTQALLASLLSERTGRRSTDFEVRVVARVVTAAITEAAFEWMRSNGRESLDRLVDRALEIVESGVRLAAWPTGSPASAERSRRPPRNSRRQSTTRRDAAR